MIKLICKICKKEFLSYPSRVGKKYCSRPCMNIGHKGLHRGKEIKKGQHLSPNTEFKKGQRGAHTKGGYRNPVGYLWVWQPKHHRANKSGYVLNSVIVMEQIIGRPLLDAELVHHSNQIKSDDRPENLKIMNKNQHLSLHASLRWEEGNFR